MPSVPPDPPGKHYTDTEVAGADSRRLAGDQRLDASLAVETIARTTADVLVQRVVRVFLGCSGIAFVPLFLLLLSSVFYMGRQDKTISTLTENLDRTTAAMAIMSAELTAVREHVASIDGSLRNASIRHFDNGTSEDHK